MAVPLLDNTRDRELLAELESAAAEVVRSGIYIGGEHVTGFENEVASYHGDGVHAIGMSSGTDALLAVLMGHGIGPGDAVALPVYTFFATAGVVSRLGARPVFVDVEPVHQNIDPDALERTLDANPDVKAVMVVHLFGAGAGMARLLEIAQSRDLPLIEDAAQAIGTRIDGQLAGTIGQAGCFSAYPTKNLGGLGDAGFVLTRDEEFAQTMRQMRNHGQTGTYEHSFVGGNFRLDALQAAFLRIKLRRLEDMTAERRSNATRYRRLFAERGLDDTLRLPIDIEDRHTYHQFSILAPAEQRDGIVGSLRSAKIGCGIYYPLPLHLQPCFDSLGHGPGEFKIAEQLAAENFALPIFPGLTDAEATEVVDRIEQAVRQPQST